VKEMRRTIIVGVDGSAASAAALRWAVEHATVEHRAVTAVEVCVPTQLAPGTSYAPAPHGLVPPPERARSTLHRMVVRAREGVPDAPEVAEVQLRGEPGTELARIAHDADMLVLGHMRHGRTAEFLFGRVTGECLRHAGVPVVLVPAQP
jgi:nucleotide-binding universal stress UspA family protein